MPLDEQTMRALAMHAALTAPLSLSESRAAMLLDVDGKEPDIYARADHFFEGIKAYAKKGLDKPADPFS